MAAVDPRHHHRAPPRPDGRIGGRAQVTGLADVVTQKADDPYGTLGLTPDDWGDRYPPW